MSKKFSDRIALLIAEKVRDIATRQGNVPFLKGDLRKSLVVHLVGLGKALLTSNLPYARAVHDGRPQVTIRPKRKKALFWKGAKRPVKKVVQPARDGKPFILEAIDELQEEGFGFLDGEVDEMVIKKLEKSFRNNKIVIK